MVVLPLQWEGVGAKNRQGRKSTSPGLGHVAEFSQSQGYTPNAFDRSGNPVNDLN